MKIDYEKRVIDYYGDDVLEFTSGPAHFATFPAAAGTHTMVDGGETKASPGAVDAFLKIDINGTTHYVPSYTSKTT